MTHNLNLFGNHRGGTSIVRSLPAPVAAQYDTEWLLADPKDDRAARLATEVQTRFPSVRPRPLQLTAEAALAHSGAEDSLVLALDTVEDTKGTLDARRPRQRATFQLVGRGPGGTAGTRIAIGGTLVPGDDETVHGAALLLETLNGLTRAASSRALTQPDPLTATVLRPMRDLATRQTIRHLAEREREPQDLSLGPLSTVLGTTVYPLVVAQGESGDRYHHRRDLALHHASRVPAGHWVDRGVVGRFLIVAVLVLEEPAVHFMTIAENRTSKRRVDGVTVFAPTRSVTDLLRQPSAPDFGSDQATFTD